MRVDVTYKYVLPVGSIRIRELERRNIRMRISGAYVRFRAWLENQARVNEALTKKQLEEEVASKRMKRREVDKKATGELAKTMRRLKDESAKL